MIRSVLVCSTAFFISCMNTVVSVPLLIDQASAPSSISDSWMSYGACYVYDELFIESSYYSSPWISTPLNKIIFNKKLRILSHEGVGYGTIEIPVYASEPKSFRVTLTNAEGGSIALNNGALRKEYLKKGAIVVPNVTAGCEITVYVEYETRTPITYYEYSFARAIPVLVSKFTFSTLQSLSYDFKSYNLALQPKIEEKEGRRGEHLYRYHVYELDNVIPRPRLEYQAYADNAEKWVAIVLRRAMDQPVFTDWSRLAADYEKVYFPLGRVSPEGKAATLVQMIKRVKHDDFELADSLLQWTQEHIIQDENEIHEVNLSRVMETQKGNLWEITALVRQLFKIAGFSTDIVITRSREMGGFDKDFVAPMVLVVPLVVVTIDSSGYVAFPFRRGGKLGEYPEIFNGNYGLSLTGAQPVALPQSSSVKSGSASCFTIDCRKEVPEQTAEITLYGGFAFDTRSFLRTIENKKHYEFIQKWLTELGTSNALGQCSISGIYAPGLPLTIKAGFSNPNQIIKKGTMMHIKLSNIFDRYYQSYDTLREEDFVTVRSVDDTETVHIITKGAKASHSFECRECSNRLFTVACEATVTGDTMHLRRITHIDSVSIDKEEMRRIYPDILANNRITESSIAITKASVPVMGKNKKR